MTRYHRLPIAQKRTEYLARMRESLVSCPHCDTLVTPTDLLGHVDQRCEGPGEPGPGSRWISWREARALVPKGTLMRWVDQGFVRFTGERQDRRYLYRDLAVKVAQRRGFRRR